jgi:centrosomal protein CEP76
MCIETGSLNKVTVGILEIRLELRPQMPIPITHEVLTTQQSMERTNKAQRERLFITYAKRWWDEYLQIRSSHNERLVKIFARVGQFKVEILLFTCFTIVHCLKLMKM